MFSVMFWGCLVITLLALALAGPQRNGTGDTVRQQCLSAAFEIVFLMIAISGIEAILLIPYGFRIICCMLIAALIIAYIMILCPNNISTKSVLSRKGGVRP